MCDPTSKGLGGCWSPHGAPTSWPHVCCHWRAAKSHYPAYTQASMPGWASGGRKRPGGHLLTRHHALGAAREGARAAAPA